MATGPMCELALLQLKDGITVDSPDIASKLKHVRDVRAKASSKPFYFLHSIEEPDKLYMLGSWNSVDEHSQASLNLAELYSCLQADKFVASEDNEALRQTLRDQLDILNILHFLWDEQPPIPSADQVLAIAKHAVPQGTDEEFEQAFEPAMALIEKTVPAKAVWAVEQDAKGNHQWVVFSVWDSPQAHYTFAGTEEFAKVGLPVKDKVDGSEFKHATLFV